MKLEVIKRNAKIFLETKNLDNREYVSEYYRGLTFKNRSQAKKLTGISYIGSVNSSSKIVKGEKFNYDTFIVYMSPFTSSGYNTCAKASEGCSSACLNESGRVRMDVHNNILSSRLWKTWLFYANREFFNAWLFAEIESANRLSLSKGRKFSVRLNGTTDLDISLFRSGGVNILDKFSDIQFYDYTKFFNRLVKYKTNNNYHLTFSHSGENDDEVNEALKGGFNVAVTFYVPKGRQLPTHYKGFGVLDGDITDLRFLDDKAIVGLRVKMINDKNKIAKAIDKGFIVV